MSDRLDFTEAKSIHILACPFQINVEKKAVEKFKDFGWTVKNMDYSKDQDWLKKRENFMRYQYFNGTARTIFCGTENGSCTVFEYGKAGDWNYYMNVGEKDYFLPIDEIELHLYDCSVGILMMRILNFDYKTIDDIKVINDYIRRVSIPFLPVTTDGYILCAEKIGIVNHEKENVCVTNFREKIIRNTDLHSQAEFIEKIIFHELGKEESAKKELDIEYYADDRMFSMCLLRDNDLSGKLKETLENRSEQMTDLLYTLIYADSGKEATCRDEKMKNELLDLAIYRRWLKEGTIYGATPCSMICITGETSKVNESVVRPFAVEYAYIYSLVLAQKYGISEFSEMAGKSVIGIEKKGAIKQRKAKKLNDLHEKYVAFKNKLMLIEITPQDQGVDIYHLLQKQLRIAEEQMILDEQLQSLYEIINTSNGTKLNKWACVFAIITIVMELSVLDWNQLGANFSRIWSLILSFL